MSISHPRRVCERSGNKRKAIFLLDVVVLRVEYCRQSKLKKIWKKGSKDWSIITLSERIPDFALLITLFESFFPIDRYVDCIIIYSTWMVFSLGREAARPGVGRWVPSSSWSLLKITMVTSLVNKVVTSLVNMIMMTYLVNELVTSLVSITIHYVNMFDEL